MSEGSGERLRVLVAGAGVAGLETILALRELTGDVLSITLLAPEAEFTYRPMTVREPFGYARANRYPLPEIADDLGVELIQDSLERVDGPQRAVRTESGRQLEYDALMLGLGAQASPRFAHAITIDAGQLDEQLHGLIQDVEDGYVRRLAFVAPSVMPWPLPLYELALMVARRAYDMNVGMSITVATPEYAPLALFGTTVSEQVEQLLEEHGILTIPSAHCEVPEKGQVVVAPGERTLQVDRIIALPQLTGPAIPGVPRSSPDGFITVDEHCQVRGLERVWAAGDATDFPVKMGGIAAQQADVAAAEIARLAGAGVERGSFEPEIHALLLGLPKPLYLSAQLTGGHGTSSEIGESATWSPPSKIAARHLAPYLEARDRAAKAAR